MLKKGMIWKGLVVGIIILFICVSFAPTINFNTVRASAEDEFFEVTTQALGIKGYEDTMVKLTRQQYHDLEQYLNMFQEKLNQTSTREEAIPLFNEAVVELDKYGLLPKGMSIEQAQRLVTISYDKQLGVFDSLDLDPDANYFCLVAGATTKTFGFGPLRSLAHRLFFLLYSKLLSWCFLNSHLLIAFIMMFIVDFITLPILIFGGFLSRSLPFLLLSTLTFGMIMLSGKRLPSRGQVITIGANGLKRYGGGNVWGAVKAPIMGISKFFPGALGFTGLQLNFLVRSFFLGSAIKVKLISSSYPPNIV